MRETVSEWAFVLAAYGTGVAATLALVAWSVWAMRAAERRRDLARGRRDA